MNKDLLRFRHRDKRAGQVTLETLLMIAGVVVPLALLILAVLALLKPYYTVTNWLITLAFP